MSDYFHLNASNFKELLFDLRELREVFEQNTESFTSDFNVNKLGLGKYRLLTEPKGNIHFTQRSLCYNKNVITQNKEGIQNVSLHFKRTGEPSYEIDKNGKIAHEFRGNQNQVFFMHEDCRKRELFFQKNWQEYVSLHLSFRSFERLANFYPDLFAEAFQRYEKGESFYLREDASPITSEMYHILSQIENSSIFGCGEEAYVDAKVLELLTLQFQAASDEKLKDNKCHFSNSDCNKIQEAGVILLSNIHTPPSVRELALQVGLNEKKLQNGFKDVFHNTVYGYLFDYKMQLAKQLLYDTNKTITEIALQCGYNYPSHFCTAFKRKHAISPQEIRKKI